MREITKVEAYRTNANLTLSDGTFMHMDYDFCDSNFFESPEEAENYIIDFCRINKINFDAWTILPVMIVFTSQYTAKTDNLPQYLQEASKMYEASF